MNATGRRGSGTEYRDAQAELEMVFATADATLGLHGSGFEGLAKAWDEAAINEMHSARHRLPHRQSLWRLGDAKPTFLRFRDEQPERWADAAVTFLPRRWPERLATELARGPHGGSLVGLALTGDPLRERWHQREERQREAAVRALLKAGDCAAALDLAVMGVEPSASELLTLAAWEAEYHQSDVAEKASQADAVRIATFFRPLRSDAERRLGRALQAYDALMQERQAERRRARVAEVSA